MKVVANISLKHCRLDLIPAERHGEIRTAYERCEFLWIVKVWNDHSVTNPKLCAACPDSVAVVKTFTPELWVALT